MSQFHNPFHFVTAGTSKPPDSIALDDLSTARHIAHDRYESDLSSGRIVCRITVETPTLFANEQQDRSDENRPERSLPKLLNPFSPDGGATPGIPASGLRGMISAIAEAATRSSLRILEDTPLSHRMAMMTESLSAMGLLVDVNGCLELQPLTLPTLPQTGWRIGSEWRRMFPSGTRCPLLKAYIEGYQRAGQTVRVTHPSFLERHNPDSASADSGRFWYAKLGPAPSVSGDTLLCANPRLTSVRPNRPTAPRFLVGQQITGDPISDTEWQRLPAHEQATWTRGKLRVLGLGRTGRPDMPTTKKHEAFIPYPPGSESLPTFDCTAALARFHALADERTAEKAELPFSVQGSQRNATPSPRNQKLRLRAGDIVFFRPTPDGTTVEEVSVSSIWRAGNGSVHEYFAALSPELLPFNPSRKTLSIAEQLFGVVEDRKEGQKVSATHTAITLASRLRFSQAALHTAPTQGAWQPVTDLLSASQIDQMQRLRWQDYPLQNLASPKPPSPALYFKSSNGAGAYIPKGSLRPGKAQPQGRKFYLRRSDPAGVSQDQVFVAASRLQSAADRDAIAKQHQSVARVVRPGTVFYFHIDIDNLTRLELSLLLWCLSPDASFRHQGGHGKPFGLGQMHLQPVGLLTVNRHARYATDALTAPRWHHAFADEPDVWPASLGKGITSPLPFAEKLAALRREFETWATSRKLGGVLQSLRLLGNPASVRHPVHYPQPDYRSQSRQDVENGMPPVPVTGPEMEQKSYEWFVSNDSTVGGRQTGQFLRPLVNESGHAASSLPSFHREQREVPPTVVYQQAAAGQSPAAQQARAVQERPVLGQKYSFTALKHDKEERVPWETKLGEKSFRGYLAIRKAERATYAARFPKGSVLELEVQGDTDPLQLTPPAANGN